MVDYRSLLNQCMQPYKKILFVTNRVSGNKDQKWPTIITEYFAGKPFNIKFLELDNNINIHKLYKDVSYANCDIVVAVGGDGTVSLLTDICSKIKTPLGIIPAGSANGMAKELNIPPNANGALAVIEKGNYETIHCISINGNTCIHLSDVGMNAQLIKYFEDGKLRGKIGYAKVVLKTLANRVIMDVKLKNDKAELSYQGVMVVIANASKYGTGAVINPIGNLTDDFFEIVIVKKLSVRALLRMLVKPGIFNPKDIQIYHASEISIKTGSKIHFQIDGEYKGKVKNIEARILPSYLKVIIPENV